MQQQLKNLDAAELMNFVSDNYHISEKRNLSSLNQCFKLMPAQDMKNHPELIIIRNHFTEIKKLLEKHLTDSEVVDFPAIKKQHGSYDLASLKSRIHLINDEISGLFMKIQTLSNNYVPPPDASGWMKLCYALLYDLAGDTSLHLFIEESILPLKLGA